MLPGAGFGRQIIISGQTKPAGGVARAGAPLGHSAAAWLSTPVTAIQSMIMPKITESQLCHLRIETILLLLRIISNSGGAEDGGASHHLSQLVAVGAWRRERRRIPP